MLIKVSYSLENPTPKLHNTFDMISNNLMSDNHETKIH